MKNYYNEFLEKNNELMLDIYNKMVENHLFVVQKGSQNSFGFGLNNNDNEDEERILVRSTWSEILVRVRLKDLVINLKWSLDNLTKKERNKVYQFEGFSKPESIEIFKTKDLDSQVRSVVSLFNNNDNNFILEIDSYQEFKDKDNYNIRYENIYRVMISKEINVLDGSDNYQNRPKELEVKYQFARQLPNSKLLENNLDLLGKYVCEGENFSESFKDLLLLDSDVNKEDIDALIILMPNINLFSQRIEEIYKPKSTQNIKNKL